MLRIINYTGGISKVIIHKGKEHIMTFLVDEVNENVKPTNNMHHSWFSMTDFL